MNRLNRAILGASLAPLAFLTWTPAMADGVCGTEAPQVMILGLPDSVEQPTVELTGEVIGNCLSSIVRSVGGGSETPIPATTEWDGVWSFGPVTVPLNEGDNSITVTADGALGSHSATANVVFNQPPPPEPPPLGAGVIFDMKTKMTAYVQPGLDRYNAVGRMRTSDEPFAPPCDKEIIVTGYAEDPDNSGSDLELFSQIIQPGDYSSCTGTRYRRVRSQAGEPLRELYMEILTADKVYLYVYAENVDFPLPVAKSAPEYLDGYVNRIRSHRLDIKFSDKTWSGRTNAPADAWDNLKPCPTINHTTYIGKKDEGRCNR
jgi:hypothetical protein